MREKEKEKKEELDISKLTREANTDAKKEVSVEVKEKLKQEAKEKLLSSVST